MKAFGEKFWQTIIFTLSSCYNETGTEIKGQQTNGLLKSIDPWKGGHKQSRHSVYLDKH